MYAFLLLAHIAFLRLESNVVAGDSDITGTIIGGEDTDISQVPYMVLLVYKSYKYCGGVIINEHTILTAAHCLNGLAGPDGLSVRCGSSFFHEGGRVYKAESFKVHHKFNDQTIDYDVGLIRLAEPIEFDKNAKPAPLSEKPPEAGTVVRVSGWGKTKVLESAHLKSVELDIVDWEKCKKLHTSLTPRMICAARAGKDSCQGDSGGGLEHNGTIVGVVSFGKSCADPVYPGVYANVADPEILEFIKQNLN